MKLDICHVTKYEYTGAVADSVNEIRLTPRTNYRQGCYHHRITVEPPAALLSYEDFFGNRVHAFTVNEMHQQLVITVHSTVVTHDNDKLRKSILTPIEDWQLLHDPGFQDKYAEYLLPTAYASFDQEVTAYAESIKQENDGVFEWVQQFSSSIFQDFEYQPFATQVKTTAQELIRIKQGVCQDFAHLMIAVCRIQQIPARYVSGYHFIGDLVGRTSGFEQASHAWIEAYIPGTGWIGFDPTNNNIVDWRYVKLGHGRDYLDIVPAKGVYRGSPEQKLTVEVDVSQVQMK